MKRGILIILSGPSGVGKGTIRKLFMDNEELNLAYSISMTTRVMRDGEVEGVDYFFVTRDEFEQAIKNDELLEYAEFVGNYYGTPQKYVNELLDQGKNVVLEIEVDGARQVLSKVPDALSVFIIPPNLQELEKRIRNRRSEPDDIIKKRLDKASSEMNLVKDYRFIVCNDKPELAAEIITLIIKRHMN